ncbi:MAG: hypothetical protein JWO67_6379 [Streptosporangiaceae bacterium]|nr:hypothetical protein [Streptosporangiaceae bacterium]
MKGGEAYELTRPDPMLGDRRPARVEIYRIGPATAQVRCIDADGDEWWVFRPLNDGRVPAGWRLVGLAKPSGRMWDGREVWRVPGPPWGRDLCWAGPGAVLLEHAAGPRPGWLGPEVGPATGPCRTLAEAQAAADAWWLAEVGAHVTRGQANGQRSLFDTDGVPA